MPRIPRRLADFLGLPLTEDAVRRCFSCHVTNPQAVLGDDGSRGGRPCDRLREVPRPGRQSPAGRRRQVPRPGDRPPQPGLGRARGEDLRPVPQPPRQGRLAGRPDVGPVPGHDPDLEPLLYREQRQARLRDLPRPAPRRRDVGGALRGQVPVVPRPVLPIHELPAARTRRFDLADTPPRRLSRQPGQAGCVSCHMPTRQGRRFPTRRSPTTSSASTASRPGAGG